MEFQDKISRKTQLTIIFFGDNFSMTTVVPQIIPGKLKFKKHTGDILHPEVNKKLEKKAKEEAEKEARSKIQPDCRDMAGEINEELPWVPPSKPFSPKEVFGTLTNTQLKFLKYNRRYYEHTIQKVASTNFQKTNENYNEMLKKMPMHNDLEGD